MEIIGTFFYGRLHSQETILECLASLAERNSLAALQRVKGIKEDTVLGWLREAAQHVEYIEALLLVNYHLTRAQLDPLWTYVGHRGEKGGIQKKRTEAPFPRRGTYGLAWHHARYGYSCAARSAGWAASVTDHI